MLTHLSAVTAAVTLEPAPAGVTFFIIVALFCAPFIFLAGYLLIRIRNGGGKFTLNQKTSLMAATTTIWLLVLVSTVGITRNSAYTWERENNQRLETHYGIVVLDRDMPSVTFENSTGKKQEGMLVENPDGSSTLTVNVNGEQVEFKN